jgi:hypothetical protein
MRFARKSKSFSWSIVLFLGASASVPSPRALAALPEKTEIEILSSKVVTAVSASEHAEVLRLISEHRQKGFAVPTPLLLAEARSAYAERDTSRALSAMKSYLSNESRDAPQYANATALYPAYERAVDDTSDWQQARKAGTQSSLAAYRQKWPSGLYVRDLVAEAERLETIAWREAVRVGTERAFRSFSQAWPDGPHQALLEQTMASAEGQAWAKATSLNTLVGFDEYIAAWPRGTNQPQAEKLADVIAWNEAQSAGGVRFSDYLERNGHKAFEAEAKLAIVELKRQEDQLRADVARRLIGAWQGTFEDRDDGGDCVSVDTIRKTYRFDKVDTPNRLVTGTVKYAYTIKWSKVRPDPWGCPDGESAEAITRAVIHFGGINTIGDQFDISVRTSPIDCRGSDDSFCKEYQFTNDSGESLTLLEDGTLRDRGGDVPVTLKRIRK